VLPNPLLHVLGIPDLSHAEDRNRLRKVGPRHDLVHSLPADAAEASTDLCRAHQLHDGQHSQQPTCRLTRRLDLRKTSRVPSPFRDAICAICGDPFQTRSKTTRTCGHSCGAILRERQTPSQGAAPKEDATELVDKVRELYESGRTMAEVAELTGTTVKILQRLMPRHGIRRRGFGKRDQQAENNDSWLGDQAGYSAMHARVIAARGRPQRCACCDTTDSSIRYEWANLSGHYEDIRDYARLCPGCHRKLDARRRAALGHHTMLARGGGVSV
jgi:hypothetical protein